MKMNAKSIDNLVCSFSSQIRIRSEIEQRMQVKRIDTVLE